MQQTVSDPSGRFSVDVPPHTGTVDLIVLAPGYPVQLVSVGLAKRDDESASERYNIVVGGAPAGVLRVQLAGVPPWPAIRKDGSLVGLRFLLFPQGMGRSFFDREGQAFSFEVEAGVYTLCPDLQVSPRCLTAAVAPGQSAGIDARNLWSDEERRQRGGQAP
jgi:hypothetical protein